MAQLEQLVGPLGPAPRFAINFRGYDRIQVDAWLEAHGRQVADAQSRLAEMAYRTQGLESRVSGPEPDAPEDTIPEALATHVVDRAHEIARQLPERVVRDAEAEREALQRSAAEAVETARSRSAQIVQAARHERDEARATMDKAREQTDIARRQATEQARVQVQRRWEDAAGALAGVELELAGLGARRRDILAELAQLEQSLAESREHLRQHGVAEVEARTEPKGGRTEPKGGRTEPKGGGTEPGTEPGPEHDRWPLMPIEW
jgi:chromosome segregation ATPase